MSLSASKMKIVFLDTKSLSSSTDLSIFNKVGEFISYETTSSSQVEERIKDCDVIITNKVILSAENLSAAKNLKLIHIAATGMNNVDAQYCKDHGIKLLNVAGYSTQSVVQHTFSMLFYLIGSTKYFDEYTSTGEWIKSDIFTHHGREFFEIYNKSWGVIGLGNIGEAVADVANAFGAKVSYFSTSGKNNNKKYPSVSLDELLSSSDIISIHCPLNEKTNNLITKENLKLLKDKAIVLNLARGGVVNEKDIVSFIKNSQIKIGFDVLVKEPMSADSPFGEVLSHPQVLLTPHIAWASLEAQESLVQTIFKNIETFPN